MKWLILLLLLVAAPALALVDVTLVPASQTVNLGSTVTLTVTLNTDGTSCDGVDASINYDPAALSIVSVTPILSPFDQVLQNKTSTAGQIDYSAGTFGTPGSGTFTVATVRFTAMALGTTNITFNSTSPRKTDTALSGVSNFGTATGASVTIVAATPTTPTPTSALGAPTPTPPTCCHCPDGSCAAAPCPQGCLAIPNAVCQ